MSESGFPLETGHGLLGCMLELGDYPYPAISGKIVNSIPCLIGKDVERSGGRKGQSSQCRGRILHPVAKGLAVDDLASNISAHLLAMLLSMPNVFRPATHKAINAMSMSHSSCKGLARSPRQ